MDIPGLLGIRMDFRAMNHDEMIAVIAADRDGKEIEGRLIRHAIEFGESAKWHLAALHLAAPGKPCFNFAECEYRIKPEPPKPREWWIHPFGKGHPQPRPSAKVLTQKPSNPLWVHVREVLPEQP